ncbi:MAG TPA: PEGA domain-containing protein [Myxococcaceae bacterium]
MSARAALAGVAFWGLAPGCAGTAGAPGRGGAVRLRCTPAEAAVALDGEPVGMCSDFQDRTPLRMGGGMHRLEVTMQGYWPYVTYFAPEGARAVLEIQLSPRSTGAAP